MQLIEFLIWFNKVLVVDRRAVLRLVIDIAKEFEAILLNFPCSVHVNKSLIHFVFALDHFL